MVAERREAILERVRAAVGGGSSLESAEAAWEALPREYKRSGTLSREGVLELLAERLRDYDAHVFHVEHSALAGKVAEALTLAGVRRVVIPYGLPEGVLPQGFQFVVDEGFSAAELDGFGGVLTMATLAIAETGTVVLQNTLGQGRRAATLVPDYHLCLVREEDVVETVPEAMAVLQRTAMLATTFVSGPSATADIEMTRIKGVHGPRVLHVVLVSRP